MSKTNYREVAKLMLANSLINLEKQKGQLIVKDLHSEVVANACLIILRENAYNVAPDISAFFVAAAAEMFPNDFTENEALSAMFLIQQNITHSDFEPFVRKYFWKNHNINIDNIPHY